MTEQHPITPPPELIKDWHDEWNESDQIVHSAYTHIAICAAQWGADQELEACCEWVDSQCDEVIGNALRADRRPNPPSLAEEALNRLQDLELGADPSPSDYDDIRRALERLQQLENNQ